MTVGSRTGEKSLTPKEYQRLLGACGSLEEELIIKIPVSLGLRRADLAKIEIKNIDLVEGKLLYFEHKKRKWITRPIGPDLLQVLTKYLNTLPKKQEYLFQWGRSRYGDRTAHRRFHDLCYRAGIPKRPIHALRATCIKFKQAEGWSVEATAKLIDDTVKTVQEHYSIPSDAEITELMREKEGLGAGRDP